MELEITDKTFKAEVLNSKEKVLVMFWGSWCPVCKRVEVLLKEIVEESKTTINIKKINIDRNPITATNCNIMGTPSFCLFENGKMIDIKVGSQSKEQLLKMFD